MQRIHFSARDLTRVRLNSTAGPGAETAFAADLLGRPSTRAFEPWRRQVTANLSRPRQIGPPGGGASLPELFELLRRGGEDAPLLLASERSDRTAEWLLEVWRVAVAPYWRSMTAYLDTKYDAFGRIVMNGGAERLLGSIHPRIVWSAPVLEIYGVPSDDIHLDGRGLLLCPSVFLSHRPGYVVPRTGDEQSILVVAAPPDEQRSVLVPSDLADGDDALGALVGGTRAAALRALRDGCTTSQLAAELGISPAGASQHATVLRRTGLITTRRIRNTVLHTATPLGRALLAELAWA